MKTALFFIGSLLLAIPAMAQQRQSRPDGVIYGTVIGEDGQPAKGLGLTAHPLGVALGAVLPRTTTNQSGAYRFENLPWWGRYTVYADDEEAGYSLYSNDPARDVAEVEVRPEHREARINLRLPPKAGFLHLHVTNQVTGAAIPAMRLTVMSIDKPDSVLFTMSCSSTHVVLVPPDMNLLIHVTSDGFREWDESVVRGRPINVQSGTRISLDVQLLPSN